MFKSRKSKTIISLLILCWAIKIFSMFPPAVERYYSNGIYRYISSFLRIVSGWLPFSIGDVLYTIAVIWFLFGVIKFIVKLFRPVNKKHHLLQGAYTLASVFMWVYILFHILWGLNYDREGIAKQLNLSPKKEYGTEELNNLSKELILKTNQYRSLFTPGDIDSSYKNIRAEAINAYDISAKTYPFLSYRFQSIKVPVYNVLGNYLGYSGYLNPFTNEAQVNTRQPAFLLPFVVCHEISHQLGYGTEDEANFAGYITARNSPENYFKYSTYFQLMRYANNELYYRDSTLAIANEKLLDTLVKQDMQYLADFFNRYKNPFEKYAAAIYNQYLKSNNQPQGLATYNNVTAWLLAYKEKYKAL